MMIGATYVCISYTINKPFMPHASFSFIQAIA